MQRRNEVSAVPAWSRHIPRQYWPIVPQLCKHHTSEKEDLLLAQWESIKEHLKQLDPLEHKELIDNEKLEPGFTKFCVDAAAEQTRSERRVLLATAAVAFLSCCTVVVLGAILVTVIGGTAEVSDWVVTAACLLVLKILDSTPTHRRIPTSAVVCAGLILLSAGPVLAAYPQAAAQFDLFLRRLAGEGTGLALGVFLAGTAAAVIVTLRGVLRLTMDRAERLRHRTVIPDVKAFEQFHSIVRDMLDKDLILIGRARVRLASRIASAAARVEDIENLYAGLDGLGHQQRELRQRLQSLSRYLRQETQVLTSTTESDVAVLKHSLICLAAISLGHAGHLPEAAVGQQHAKTHSSRFELAKLRVFAWSLTMLCGVVANAVTHLNVGPGTAISVAVLVALLAAFAPERWLREIVDLRSLSWVTGWFHSGGRRNASDEDPQGDQR